MSHLCFLMLKIDFGTFSLNKLFDGYVAFQNKTLFNTAPALILHLPPSVK